MTYGIEIKPMRSTILVVSCKPTLPIEKTHLVTSPQIVCNSRQYFLKQSNIKSSQCHLHCMEIMELTIL